MTVETHGMQFVVDASGVAKGFRDYEAAVDGIFKSLDKFEKKVAQTMSGIERAASNRAALAGFKKSLDQFSNINIDTRAASKLSTLSAAMSTFKAPSEAQSLNTRKFFSSLSNLPDLSRAYASIKNLSALKASMESFKAPPLTQANNLVKFAQAIEKAGPALSSLKKVSGVSGIANELASISIAISRLKVPNASQINNLGQFGLALQHLGRVNVGETGNMIHALAGISNFKAPSAANIRNLVAFAEALHTIKPIPQAAEIAAQMNMIASAASRASISLGGFRGNLGGFNASYGRFNEGTRSAKVEMMGLQNAFSTTFQVGSVLRSLLGSLTIAELGRSFFQATQTANQFTAAMQVLGESPMMSEVAWERVRADANHFGADLNNMAENFSKFSLAANANGVSLQESFKIYEGFQTVMTATHMGNEQQQSVGLAIREMMDQGYVATQRLTRQLGLVLPGATKTLMEAWKAAGEKTNFWDALKKKMVDSTWALDVLSNHYKNVFGPGVEQALKSPIQQFNILKNNIMQMMVEIGDAGAKKAFADLIAQISGYMDPGKVHTFTQSIGVALTGAVNKASQAIKFLHDHWNSIVVPLGHVIKLMAEWEILMGGLQIGKWIISPLMGMARVLPLLQSAGAYINVLAAKSLPAAAAGMEKLKGAQLTAAESALRLRTAVSSTAVGMEEEAVAANTLSASLLRVGDSAWGATKGGLRGLVNMVGGPWIATIGAAVIAGKMLYDQFSDDNAVMENTKNTMTETAKAISETNARLYLTSKALDNANKSGIDFDDCIRASGQNSGLLDQMTAKLDKATNGLWSMASAAIEARRQILQLQLGADQGQAAALKTMSAEQNRAQADVFDKQGQQGAAFLTRLHAGWANIMSLMPFHAGQGEINSNIGTMQKGMADLQKEINSLPTVDQEMALMKKNGITGAPDSTKPRYQGTEGKDKKGKKGKDPYTVLKETENAVDTLMNMLEAKDPIGKLYTQFVANIDKEAQKLLTLGGYRQFLENVKVGAKDAAGETQALVKVLQSGKGLNEKVMSDIKDRYGIEASGIIELTNALLSDLAQATVEAATKTLDATYRGVIKAHHALDAYNPMGKVDDDAQKKQLPIAQQLFATSDKNDTTFKNWYEGIVSGSSDGMDSLKALQAAVIAAKDSTGKFHDNLVALEHTGVDVNKVLAGMRQGLIYERYEAEMATQVGGKLLAQKADELKLMSLSNDQASIMKELQTEVQDRLKAGLGISAQEIADLKQKIALNQQLAQQMDRNKQFFDDNGVRSYLNGIKDVGSAINDLDKNFLQSLDDQLVSLGETGKFSFNSIFDTIRNGMIKMAADGLTQNFAKMLFGKGELDGGTPSIFGSTIGKWMGGYQAKQTNPLGSSGANPLYVKWAGDYNSMGVSTQTGQFINGKEKLGQVLVGGVANPASLNQTRMLMGTSATTPMWVKDANNPLGTGGGSGIMFPNGNKYGYDQDGYLSRTGGGGAGSGPFGGADDLFDVGPGGGGSSLLDMMQGGGKNDPTTIAGTKVANNFMSSMSSIMPMIGMTFAGAFKSPIAQTAAMFGSMILQQLMQSMAGGGGGGGGGGMGGGLLSLFGSLLGGAGGGAGGALSASDMSFMDDTAALMGYREGGIVGQGVGGTYRSHPSAFINAPHYAEGTANTSGIPAMLHDNEAVIPLSRGRKVPVELTSGQSSGNGKSVQINFNVTSPDADSFQSSKQQIMTNLHVAASRAYARNN